MQAFDAKKSCINGPIVWEKQIRKVFNQVVIQMIDMEKPQITPSDIQNRELLATLISCVTIGKTKGLVGIIDYLRRAAEKTEGAKQKIFQLMADVGRAEWAPTENNWEDEKVQWKVSTVNHNVKLLVHLNRFKKII